MAGIDEVFKFQDNAITIGNGNICNIGSRVSMILEIWGTATTRTINFYSKNINGDLVSLNGYNSSTSAMATSTIGISPETWEFDIEGLNQVCMNISSISSGNVNVVGRLMD